MQQTTNCGLKKPEANEYYNVGDFNYNADVIDAALKGLEDGKADIGPDGKVPAEQLPEIQKITDKFVAEIDEMLKHKEAEVMEI